MSKISERRLYIGLVKCLLYVPDVCALYTRPFVRPICDSVRISWSINVECLTGGAPYFIESVVRGNYCRGDCVYMMMVPSLWHRSIWLSAATAHPIVYTWKAKRIQTGKSTDQDAITAAVAHGQGSSSYTPVSLSCGCNFLIVCYWFRSMD